MVITANNDLIPQSIITGRICTEFNPIEGRFGFLSRIFRFGRSFDEMHSRQGRQAEEAGGHIFDEAQQICEVRSQIDVKIQF